MELRNADFGLRIIKTGRQAEGETGRRLTTRLPSPRLPVRPSPRLLFIPQSLSLALGDDFVERVLEEDSFQAVARVSRRSLTRERLRLVGVVALAEDAQRQVVEQPPPRAERGGDCGGFEGADLEAEAGGVP